RKGPGRMIIVGITKSEPESGFRPSVDVLFRSAAKALKRDVIAIIMTGMGTDGTKGSAALKKEDAFIIVQDKKSSVVWGMPGSVVESQNYSKIVNLEYIPAIIVDEMNRSSTPKQEDEESNNINAPTIACHSANELPIIEGQKADNGIVPSVTAENLKITHQAMGGTMEINCDMSQQSASSELIKPHPTENGKSGDSDIKTDSHDDRNVLEDPAVEKNMTGIKAITDEEFIFIKQYVRDICGIVIEHGKEYLVEQRFSELIQELGMSSYKQLVDEIINNESLALKEKIITSITTGETSFFRDQKCFDGIKSAVFPQLAKRLIRKKMIGINSAENKIRIWCAASSSGQEIYSLAMLLAEFIEEEHVKGVNFCDFEILGTDISPKVLSQAKTGKYNLIEVKRGLDLARFGQYLVKDERNVTISDSIKKIVEFKSLNLITPFWFKKKFDLVLCRNVLIYFNNQTRESVLRKIYNSMEENAFLIMGSSENVGDEERIFEPIIVNDCIFWTKKAKIDNMASA
ncbi:MAG: hypothetical protein HQK54_08330, partial [Oligoflexales bacterium]|nr:hypothetical protein [Oligoflexales bacterium]